MSELVVESVTPITNKQAPEKSEELKVESVTPLNVESITRIDKPDETSALRRIPDIGVSLLKGAVDLTGSAVGLVDMIPGINAGKKLESIGVRHKEAQDILDDLYSPQQKAANKELAETKGFIPSIITALKNPSTILHSGLESLPSMVGAAGIGRGVIKGAAKLVAKEAEKKAPSMAAKIASKIGAPLAGGIGEGTMQTGSALEQIRQQSETGEVTGKQRLIAAGSGATTTLITLLGGKLAKRLSIPDFENLLVGGSVNAAVDDVTKLAKRNIIKAAIGSAINEGAFEELPQSCFEQMAMNLATGRPLMEGVPEAGAMGMLTGGTMGVGVGGVGTMLARKPTGPISDTFKNIDKPTTTPTDTSAETEHIDKTKKHIDIEAPLDKVKAELPTLGGNVKEDIESAFKQLKEDEAKKIEDEKAAKITEKETKKAEKIAAKEAEKEAKKTTKKGKLTVVEGTEASKTEVNRSEAKDKFRWASDEDLDSYLKGELSEDDVYARVVDTALKNLGMESRKELGDMLGVTTDKEIVESLKASEPSDTDKLVTDAEGNTTLVPDTRTEREKKKEKLSVVKKEETSDLTISNQLESTSQPILTDAKHTGSEIYLTFDKSGKVPTTEELKAQLGSGASVTMFPANEVSATQGKVRYRVDVFDDKGRKSAKTAEELYNKHFGAVGKEYHAESQLEKSIPLEERFDKVVETGKKAALGTTSQPISLQNIVDYYESTGLSREEALGLASIDMDYINDNPEDAPKTMEEFKTYARELAEASVNVEAEETAEDGLLPEDDLNERLKNIVTNMKMTEAESAKEVDAVVKDEKEPTTLVTKPIKEFAKSLKEEVTQSVEEIIKKANEYKDWKYEVGDRIKSKKTGKILEITGKSWSKKEDRPVYRYKIGDEESGALWADKVSDEDFTKMGISGVEEEKEKPKTAREKKLAKVKKSKKESKPVTKLTAVTEETEAEETEAEPVVKTITRKKAVLTPVTLTPAESDTTIEKRTDAEIDVLTESMYATLEEAQTAHEKLGVDKDRFVVKPTDIGYALEAKEITKKIKFEYDPMYQTLESAQATPRNTSTLNGAANTMVADVNIYLHTGEGDIIGIAKQLSKILDKIDENPRALLKEFSDVESYNNWVANINELAKYVRKVITNKPPTPPQIGGETSGTTMDFMGLQSMYESIREIINKLVRHYHEWKTRRAFDKLKTVQRRVDGTDSFDITLDVPKDITIAAKAFMSGGLLANENLSDEAREVSIDIRQAEQLYLYKVNTEAFDIDEVSHGLSKKQRKIITKLGYDIRDYRKGMNELLEKKGVSKDKADAIIRANIDAYLKGQDPVIVDKYKQIRQVYNAWLAEYKDFMKRRLNMKVPGHFMAALTEYQKTGDMLSALKNNGVLPNEGLLFSAYARDIEDVNSWGEDDYVTKIMMGELTVSEVVPVIDKKTGKQKTDKKTKAPLFTKNLLTKATTVLNAVEKAEAIATQRYANNLSIGKIVIDHSFVYEGDVPTMLSKRQYKMFNAKINRAIHEAVKIINSKNIPVTDITKRFNKIKGVAGIKPPLVYAPPTMETEDILPGEDDAFEALKIYSRIMWKKVAFDPVIDSLRDLRPEDAPTNVREMLENLKDSAKGKYYFGDKAMDDFLRNVFHIETHRAYSRFVVKPVIQAVVTLKLGYRALAGALNGIDGVARIGLEFREHYLKEGYKFLATPEGKALVEKNGWRLGSRIEDVEGHLKIRKSLLAPLGVFVLPELPLRELNFAVAYLYYRDQRMGELLQQGKSVDSKAVLEEAEEFATRQAMVSIWKLQGSNTLAEKPEILRSPTGRLFGVFMPFFVRNVEFLWANKGSFGFWGRYAGYTMTMSGPRGFLTMLKSFPLISLVMMSKGVDNWLDRLEAWMIANMKIGDYGFSGGAASAAGYDIVGPATAQWPSSSTTLSTINTLWRYALSTIGNADYKYQLKEGIKQTAIFARNWWDVIDANVDSRGFVLDAEGNHKYSITSKWDQAGMVLGITPESKTMANITHRIVLKQKQIQNTQAREIISEFRNTVQGMFVKDNSGEAAKKAMENAVEIAMNAAISHQIPSSVFISVMEGIALTREMKDLLTSSARNRLDVYELEKQANPNFPGPRED